MCFVRICGLFSLCLGFVLSWGQDSLAARPLSHLQVQCVLSDSLFVEKDSLSVFLLETGESRSIAFQQPFALDLPLDTLWNLCFNAAPSLEKCYEIKYLGQDSIFRLTVSGDDSVTWYSDSSMEALASLPDSSIDSSQEVQDTVTPSNSFEASGETTRLRKVVVQLRKKPKRRLGESVVSAKRIKRLPGLAEADVIRTLQSLPGVTASSDFSSKIYVRGGGADQNLFLFDNAVVYSPVHFFGLFSTFLVEGIDDVKFYKSGFAPQYGNRLSSVVDLRSRLGGCDTSEAWFEKSSVKISTFATQVHTEGHQGNTRWLLAGRSTYIKQVLDALKAAGAIDFSLDYKFTDLQGSVSQSFGEGRSLTLSFYNGSDVLNFDPIYIDWGNTAVPLNFRWRLDDDWAYQATASYSHFRQNMEISGFYRLYNTLGTYSLKQSMTYSGQENHEITVGYDLEHDRINFTEDADFISVYFVDTSRVWMHSLYVEDTWRPGSWEISGGLRGTYQNLADYWGIEPRLSAQYRFPGDHILSGHIGYYEQYVNSILFSDQETMTDFYYPSRKATDRTVRPTSSLLTTLGYTKEKLWKQWTFSTEAYYKTQNHLVILDLNDTSTTFNTLADMLKEGSGYSFGYELSLRRNEGVIAGGINWSQGWSVIKEQYDSVAYYPDWHQPYSLKADLSINWRGQDGLFKPKARVYWRSSFALKYASGLPYTEYLGYSQTWDLDQDNSTSTTDGSTNLVARYGSRNTSLQSPYFRLDAKLIDIGKEGKWNFSWTILNVTDHENIFMLTYDTNESPPKETKITQFPYFPILVNYEYYF
ncbi:MAG TPA: TonB-dependent receptor [Fibrobacteraceae bacterium]|nr:TonB-dependent receptor [Fibrobacteraceae bacterium]